MSRFSGRVLRPAAGAARLARVAPLSEFAGSTAARPLRFLIVGGLTFVVNIGLLVLFTTLGLGSIVAYAIALALSVQLNFAVNQLLVWHDRPLSPGRRSLAIRWISFHAWISASLLINMVAFSAAQLFMPDVAAAVAAVLVSTGFKFVSLDRFAFRSRRRAL